MKNRGGFTLVELLVAISILALVAVLGWRGLDGIVRAREQLTAQMDATRGMQLAFAQMQSDGEHLAGPHELGGGAMLVADEQRLLMVRRVEAEHQPTRLQVVSYKIEDGTLTRRESAATRDLAQLEVMWTAAVSNADRTPPVVLEHGLNGMAVRVFESNAWRTADAPGQARPPPAPASGTVVPGSRLGAPAGLEVALYVQGQEVAMTKVFIVGGV